jgi:signal transduction histidine kinase
LTRNGRPRDDRGRHEIQGKGGFRDGCSRLAQTDEVNSMNPQAMVRSASVFRLTQNSDWDPRDPARRSHRPPGGERKATTGHRRILLVEDDHAIREALQGILEDEGYEIALADNGRAALDHLRTGAAPDLIVLDLRMPVMDGWEFRAAQKSDPAFASIPVIAVSADGSAKAAAIAAHAYLRKPLSTITLLETISRVLLESERQRLLGRLEEAERFAALGRLAAGVGHEINNPLAYVSMNVDQAADELGRLASGAAAEETQGLGLAGVRELLAESRVGLDRIRDIVKNLQGLSRTPDVRRELFSLNDLLDESLVMVRNHVAHRAVIVRSYETLPPFSGNRSAMGQVYLNLLLNAAQSLPTGQASANEVRAVTSVCDGEIVVEIGDTGAGIPREVIPHIFDPFYTTKPIGEGTGLGLAISNRIVADHGGRIEVDSDAGRGTTVRVILPLGLATPEPTLSGSGN